MLFMSWIWLRRSVPRLRGLRTWLCRFSLWRHLTAKVLHLAFENALHFRSAAIPAEGYFRQRSSSSQSGWQPGNDIVLKVR